MRPSKAIRERVEKLREAINHYRTLIHEKDTEEIPESARDALMHELAAIEEKYPELRTTDSPTMRIGGAPMAELGKVPHEVSQWSFNDVFSEEEFYAFDARVKRGLKDLSSDLSEVAYTCELKIDGLKIVSTYEKGLLKTAATRGNGQIGENVTHNIRTIRSMPLRLSRAVDVIVEGEVWMGKKALKDLNALRRESGETEFANPRNVAAGSIRQLDPKIAASRPLDTFVYDVARTSEKLPATQFEELEYLKDLGFNVNPEAKRVMNAAGVIEYWKKWSLKKGKEDYLVDGIVAKVDLREYQDALGYTGKAPRFATAFKFPAEQVTTVIEDIVLQIGRTGILTPVAHLRSVNVAGVVVSRATLHNEDQIRRLDARIGDTVIIQRAGDVIPEVVSVISELRPKNSKPYSFPKHVPECGGNGAIERVPGMAAWRCVNRNSSVQMRRRLHHFAGKPAFDIDGLGPRTLDMLVDEGLVATYADIFTLTEGDLLSLERFAEISAKKLVKNISLRKHIPLDRFLISLSIPQVGEETARDIASHFGTLDKIQKALVDELRYIEGVGEIVAMSLYQWFRNPEHKETLRALLKEVSVGVTQGKVRGPFSGKIFVLTGTLKTLSREKAAEKIRALGGAVAGSVSKNTSFVVAGENPGSKLESAQKLNVAVLEESAFIKMLGKLRKI